MDEGGVTPWRELYREALFEPDPEKLSRRIDQARIAIRLRRYEIWESGDQEPRERGELEAASYFLALLRTISGREGADGVVCHTVKRVS